MSIGRIDEISALELYAQTEPNSFYTWESGRLTTHQGVVTSEGLIEIRKRCVEEQAVDVSGIAATGRDGDMKWALSDYICLPPPDCPPWRRTVWKEPVSFVATAQDPQFPSSIFQPDNVFISTGVISVGHDVTLKVESFSSSGDKVGPIRYAFRCRVAYDCEYWPPPPWFLTDEGSETTE